MYSLVDAIKEELNSKFPNFNRISTLEEMPTYRFICSKQIEKHLRDSFLSMGFVIPLTTKVENEEIPIEDYKFKKYMIPFLGILEVEEEDRTGYEIKKRE